MLLPIGRLKARTRDQIENVSLDLSSIFITYFVMILNFVQKFSEKRKLLISSDNKLKIVCCFHHLICHDFNCLQRFSEKESNLF